MSNNLQKHNRQLYNYGISLQKQLPFSFFLNFDGGKEEYNGEIFKRGRNYTTKNGQRKLLITEIYFLTQCSEGLVVYVGSAPGHHIQLLLKLFPKLKFHLYDPREHILKENNRVKIFQQFFEDKDAQKYNKENEDTCIINKDEKVIFISDIRTMEGYENDEQKAKNQQLVENDQNMQMEWVKIIKPSSFSLKFKLNWNKQFQEYLDGQLFLQSWINPYSMECRLMSFDGNMNLKKYNCKEFEERMFYYNVRERFQQYKKEKDFIYPQQYCQCHDCMSEINTINEYINKKQTNMTVEQLCKYINQLLDKHK